MSNINTDFVANTKKILSSLRQLVTSLHLIREDVKTIRDNTPENRKEPSTDQETAQSSKNPAEILNKNEPGADQENGAAQKKTFFQRLVAIQKVFGWPPAKISEWVLRCITLASLQP
jgi:hypothetical protein